MGHNEDLDSWARLRLMVIGPLFATPPAAGELRKTLQALADTNYTHPNNGTTVRFSFSTLERWYYAARKAQDPIAELRRKRRNDAGCFRCLPTALIPAAKGLYQKYPGWTVQLHYDNLIVLAEQNEAMQPMPSYSTLRRYFKSQGYHRKSRLKRNTPGAKQAAKRLDQCEVRSYEAEYVHGLWHTDFHHGSKRVLTADGRWVTPLLLCIIDDHSRLVCHLQWYLDETAESLVHGLSQAIQKRGLPRALMTDNGSAMQAGEFSSGLHILSILHETTLPYSPYQNAKQECFWATLEGRLMAMLANVSDLTLDRLNEITQVWVEHDYNQVHHSEINTSPLQRYLDGASVGRESPDSQGLKRAFRTTVIRRQRRSDGTLSLEGKRYEIPSQYRHLEQIPLRYSRWDLRFVELVNQHTHASLCRLYPLDKQKNASGQRRTLPPSAEQEEPLVSTQNCSELPPLLNKLLAEYAATGRPPAYIPKHPQESET